MFKFQSVDKADIRYFMDEVQPKGHFSVREEDCNWVFEFTSYEDYQTAEEWIYNTYNFDFYDKSGKYIGYIYYNRKIFAKQ